MPRKGRKKTTRYESRSAIPKTKMFSGKRYRLFDVKDSKKSADGKKDRLRKAGKSARVISLKYTGGEKVWYAIYKRG